MTYPVTRSDHILILTHSQEGQMSDRRRSLKLVFGNSNSSSKIEKLSSVKFKQLRVDSLLSPFQKKVGRLERKRPEAAKLIEQLVNDALDGRYRLWPPVE